MIGLKEAQSNCQVPHVQNQKFAAKAREVESQAKAEVAEAERMMEVEKGRLEAELDQKKHDLEAGAAAQESAMW